MRGEQREERAQAQERRVMKSEEEGMRELGAEQKENLGMEMSNSHLNIQET